MMISYKEPTPDERTLYLEWMREHMAGTIEAVMVFLELTWEGFAGLFETVGEVRTILEDGVRAGFLWIELRERVLHVHGIILDPAARGKGIGTTVFGDLQDEYAGRVDAIELGVRVVNEGAIRFYERIGFQTHQSIEEIGFRVLRRPVF